MDSNKRTYVGGRIDLGARLYSPAYDYRSRVLMDFLDGGCHSSDTVDTGVPWVGSWRAGVAAGTVVGVVDGVAVPDGDSPGGDRPGGDRPCGDHGAG